MYIYVSKPPLICILNMFIAVNEYDLHCIDVVRIIICLRYLSTHTRFFTCLIYKSRRTYIHTCRKYQFCDAIIEKKYEFPYDINIFSSCFSY